MQAKLFDNYEYSETLARWWFVHNKVAFSPALAAAHGIVVLNEVGTPLALCFLYFPSNSKLCQLAFAVRNPNVSHLMAGKALKLLASFSLHACRQLGYSAMYTATESKVLDKIFIKAGFNGSAKTSREFIKEI